MVLDESIMELLIFLADFLYLFFFVVAYLADLTLQLIYLFLLFLSVFSTLLPKSQQLSFAVGLGLL